MELLAKNGATAVNTKYLFNANYNRENQSKERIRVHGETAERIEGSTIV